MYHLTPPPSPLTPPQPNSPLFPYTTLFRSQELVAHPLHEAQVEQALLREVGLDHADQHVYASGQPSAGRETLIRSEEHTSELQSLRHLVCRLLLEKKKNRK